MRNTVIGLASLALAGLGLSGCGEQAGPEFAEDAAMSDLYEIEAGRLAAERGQSAAIQAYGDKMVQAHSKTSGELKEIVQRENIDVELPTQLDEAHQDMIDNLTEAEPAQFDEEYAEQQVDAHQATIDLYEDYAEDGDNGALKDFAEKTLPALQEHLEEAKQLEEQADESEEAREEAGPLDADENTMSEDADVLDGDEAAPPDANISTDPEETR